MGHGFIFFSIQSIYLDILAKILTTSGLLVVVSFWKEALDRGIIPVTLWPWTYFPIKSRGGVPAFAIRFLQGYMQRERQLHVSWLMGSPLCCNLHFLSETTKKPGAFADLEWVQWKDGETDDRGLYSKFQVSVSTSSAVVEDKKSSSGDASCFFVQVGWVF